MPGLAISEQQHQRFLQAFPRVLASDVTAATGVMPAVSDEHHREFAVLVDDEELVLPYRIYHAEPDPDAVTTLAQRARLPGWPASAYTVGTGQPRPRTRPITISRCSA